MNEHDCDPLKCYLQKYILDLVSKMWFADTRSRTPTQKKRYITKKINKGDKMEYKKTT